MSTGIKGFSSPSKMALLRFGAACVIMIAGLLALRTLAAALNWRFDKPPTPLRKDLTSVPRALGTPYKYEAVGSDLNMKPDEVLTLGTDMYLLRNYADIAKRDSAAQGGAREIGTYLTLNLNYYATGSGTVHVPEICWTASGMQRNLRIGDIKFSIPGVKLADGSVIDLPVKMLVFEPTTEEMRRNPQWKGHEDEHQLCVAYTFNVNGEYVNDRNEVVQRFWKADLPFAYHAKVEVKVAERCRPEEAQAVVGAFFREAMVEVSKCLPDANELKAKAAAATQQAAGKPGATEPAVLKESATRP
jgi:hypothetical protein